MGQIFKLKNGMLFLITEAPGGIYNSIQLKKIADLCNQDLAIVKATEDQRIGLFVKEDECDSIIEELSAVGLGLRKYQQGLHQPVSCIGELCEEHEQDALGASMDVTKAIADLELSSPLKIGINGCFRCCTPCHTLDISIIGEALGYRISLGGKGTQIPELASFMAEGVPADKLPGIIKNIVQIYQSHAGPGETLIEVMERCGVGEFVEALAPFSQDAADAEDPLEIARQVAMDDNDSQSDDIFSEQADLDFDEDNLDATEDEELALLDDVSLADDEELSFQADDIDLDDDLSPLDESQDEKSVKADEFSLDETSSDKLDEIPIQDKAESKTAGGSLSEEKVEEKPVFESSSDDDDELLSGDDFDFGDEDLEPISSDDDHFMEEDLTEEEKALLNSSDDDFNPSHMEGKLEADEAAESVDDPLLEDFGDAEGLSEEDELDFEQRLNESIDEEAKLIAAEEKDVNEGEREATIGMLASVSTDETQTTKSGLDSSIISDIDESAFQNIDEDDLEPIAADDFVADEAMAEPSPAVASTPVKQKKLISGKMEKGSARSVASFFKFSGMDLVDNNQMHLTFESGAYLDIDLASVKVGQEKSFSLGGQTFVVLRTSEGILLEVEGVRLFYPNTSIKQAS